MLRECYPYFLIAILYLALRFMVSSQSVNLVAGHLTAGSEGLSGYLFSVFQLVGIYCSRLILPTDIVHLYNTSTILPGSALLYTILGFMALGILLITIAFRAFPALVRFASVWFLLGLIPLFILSHLYTSIMGISFEISWLFFPTGGVFIMGGMLLNRLKQLLPKFIGLLLLITLCIGYVLSISENNDHWQNTESYSKHLLKIVPYNSYVLHMLSLHYIREEKPQKVLMVLNKALEYGEHDIIYYRKALAYEMLKEHLKAKESILRAISINPDKAVYYDTLGTYYYQESDFKNAEAAFLKALDIQSDNVSALVNIAGIYMLNQDYEKAVLYINSALNVKSSLNIQKPLYAKLTACHYLRKDSVAATNSFNQFLLLNPTQEDFLGFAEMAYEFNLSKLSLQALNISLTSFPDYIESYILSGIILGNLNRFDEALAIWEKGLKLQPENQSLKEHMSQLKQMVR